MECRCVTFGRFRMRGVVVGLFVLLSAPGSVRGQVLDTADLLDVCTRADINWIDFCNGDFQAVHDFRRSGRRRYASSLEPTGLPWSRSSRLARGG